MLLGVDFSLIGWFSTMGLLVSSCSSSMAIFSINQSPALAIQE
jgi:hypothetical protein